MGAVAHDQPPAVVVALAGELCDVGVDLGLQGFGEHPAGTLTHDLVDQTRRTTRSAGVIGIGTSRNYGEHGSYLPDRRWRADLA
ncbi:hypothetical protein GCM10023320_62680 [Pseudonocardia adelaidensis]|uniref:Luciferase-like monooxygenase n=1 Tax=Pseudonocardia adelaidensis TaxID=648754 RepID=A0ABP9NVA4_9PSEU